MCVHCNKEGLAARMTGELLHEPFTDTGNEPLRILRHKLLTSLHADLVQIECQGRLYARDRAEELAS